MSSQKGLRGGRKETVGDRQAGSRKGPGRGRKGVPGGSIDGGRSEKADPPREGGLKKGKKL